MLRVASRSGYSRWRASGCCCRISSRVIFGERLPPSISSKSVGLLRFRGLATAVQMEVSESNTMYSGHDESVRRLTHLRNVGVFAHVDAGKTTVTERMLALAGVVRRAGTVDDGNTVTDFLPQERERGITIQSAAISFEWGWHNNRNSTNKATGDDANDLVQIHLIDTPGHVDFSVEVNRSVAVLDGAVLVVDAVAGVQAQTETVWRAMTRPSINNHDDSAAKPSVSYRDHGHEPLPCLALVNKMDKDGCNFGSAITSLRHKLPGANPIAIQIPLFRGCGKIGSGSKLISKSIIAVPTEDAASISGVFAGVVDLVHMRAIIWPDPPLMKGGAADVEQCVPDVVPLFRNDTHEPIDPNCHVTIAALAARTDLIASLADVDHCIEDCFLADEEPTNAELRGALRRATLARKALPVMAGAALRGKGIEPVLDAVADLLPSPLDRVPPAINEYKAIDSRILNDSERASGDESMPSPQDVTLGHPLHPSLLALAFKVIHMKGRGGSGDGRVVFARVYSGKISAKDTVQIVSPPAPGEAPEKPRTERVGGMLELAGGRFNNTEDGFCMSGDVCALVGLKSVVTGDTIILASDGSDKRKKKDRRKDSGYGPFLAGVASPKPVLKVRLEAETAEEQSRLLDALTLLAIEDPSLTVEETDSSTLLSGLGELHIEVAIDRLYREFGLRVSAGAPSVAYRETITNVIETAGGTLVNYDRTIGGTRMQAAVHMVFEPMKRKISPHASSIDDSTSILLAEPVVEVGLRARDFLGVDTDASEDDLIHRCDVFKALVSGCQGALKRGPLASYPMASLKCNVVDVDALGGLGALREMPGALRAAAAHAVADTLGSNSQDSCTVLEPTMSVEVTLPAEMVGGVLSDLTSRRATVGDVFVGDEREDSSVSIHQKALITGEVPLSEILGYANILRSITAGEGSFTAEYKGHSPCDNSCLHQ